MYPTTTNTLIMRLNNSPFSWLIKKKLSSLFLSSKAIHTNGEELWNCLRLCPFASVTNRYPWFAFHHFLAAKFVLHRVRTYTRPGDRSIVYALISSHQGGLTSWRKRKLNLQIVDLQWTLTCIPRILFFFIHFL